jgi:hypothetical protein
MPRIGARIGPIGACTECLMSMLTVVAVVLAAFVALLGFN